MRLRATTNPAGIRPRDAATLVLVRHGNGEPEFLLGRRRRSARFLPGYYVFPGGALEAGDGRARPASTLAGEHVHAMGVGGRHARACALAMTAVRETFEETGLLLCESGDVGKIRGETWARMRHLGVAPALRRMHYLGRAITPTRSAIRFHARFFLAGADGLQGTLIEDGELVALGWYPFSEACRLPIIDVTGFMLAYALAIVDPHRVSPTTWPVFTQRGGRPLVRYL